PDRRLKAAITNMFQHALHVAAECRAGLEPIAHRWLITIVDLHVTQAGRVFCGEVEIVEDLLCGNAWAKAIPRAQTRRRGWKTQRWMIRNKRRCETVQQW